MGITFNMIEKMHELGMLKAGMKIMDIGTSNLYTAPAGNVISLLTKFRTYESGFDEYARILEKGALYDALGGRNESWAGDFFEKCGFKYNSLDLAKGYKTTVFDLNTQDIPDHWRGKYDLVLNFGTSEHIFNQLHVFTCIHKLCSNGGFMMHQLPISGFSDHGYFLYTTRFFVDLAYRNNYEIYFVEYNKGAFSKMYEYPERMIKYHKAFANCTFDETNLHNMAITIVFKKIHDNDFVCCKELTTSVIYKA